MRSLQTVMRKSSGAYEDARLVFRSPEYEAYSTYSTAPQCIAPGCLETGCKIEESFMFSGKKVSIGSLQDAHDACSRSLWRGVQRYSHFNFNSHIKLIHLV